MRGIAEGKIEHEVKTKSSRKTESSTILVRKCTPNSNGEEKISEKKGNREKVDHLVTPLFISSSNHEYSSSVYYSSHLLLPHFLSTLKY